MARPYIAALSTLLALAVLFAGCLGGAGFETLGTSDWKARLEATPGAFVLDVRTQAEYDAGHLPGATLIPHDQVRASAGTLPADKTTPIFVYCRSGNRSETASKTLVDLGYTNVVNMAGGYPEWAAAGYPTA